MKKFIAMTLAVSSLAMVFVGSGLSGSAFAAPGRQPGPEFHEPARRPEPKPEPRPVMRPEPKHEPKPAPRPEPQAVHGEPRPAPRPANGTTIVYKESDRDSTADRLDAAANVIDALGSLLH